ncbi:MAG: hypothetical protein Q7J68_01860, partial [Thermoplasmata archaeon]|nr:hypothetical protein [Thermoplasmata archaeon]
LILDNSEYFRLGQKQQHAGEYQQPEYYQPAYGQAPPQYGYPQPCILTCQRCGNTVSAMPGSQPFQCAICGEWMYPPG